MLACPPTLAETLVLDYADFGPQVAAHRLLGSEWWQWQSHGDSDPNRRYAIRVVVFDDESETSVRNQYPVIPSENKDYRWIPLHQALQYLNEEIRKDILERSTERLKETRMTLRRYFGVTVAIQ